MMNVPPAQRARGIKILLKFPVRDRDVAAVAIIYHNSTADELVAEP